MRVLVSLVFFVATLAQAEQFMPRNAEEARQQFEQRRAEVQQRMATHRQQVIKRIEDRFGEIQKRYQTTQSKTEVLPQVCEQQKISLDKVNFALDSTQLNSLATETLDEVANVLLQNPSAKAEVAGHADVRGAKVYNDTLSMNRACSVVHYLEDKGVATSQLIPKAYGETQPVNKSLNEADHAINRRVEITPK